MLRSPLRSWCNIWQCVAITETGSTWSNLTTSPTSHTSRPCGWPLCAKPLTPPSWRSLGCPFSAPWPGSGHCIHCGARRGWVRGCSPSFRLWKTHWRSFWSLGPAFWQQPMLTTTCKCGRSQHRSTPLWCKSFVRLGIFGDFDLFEFEGLDTTYKPNGEEWEPVDPDPGPDYVNCRLSQQVFCVLKP